MPPFSDPEKRREYNRKYYRKKYQSDPEFRKQEAERKAAWFEGNLQRLRVMRDYIARKREAERLKADTPERRKRLAELDAESKEVAANIDKAQREQEAYYERDRAQRQLDRAERELEKLRKKPDSPEVRKQIAEWTAVVGEAVRDILDD